MATWAIVPVNVLVIVAGFVVTFVHVPLLRRATWFGDLLVLALPLGCIALVVLGIVLLAIRVPTSIVAATGGVFAGCVAHCALPRQRVAAPPPAAPVLLVSVNLQYDSADPRATVRSALDARPDVLVACEVTTVTEALLRAAFPYHLVSQDALRINDNAVGIYSHLPFEELAPLPPLGREALRIRVNGPHPFVLCAVHLPRPVIVHDGSTGLASMAEHRRAVHRLDDAVRAEVEPVVLIGDLNLSDRTVGYRVLTAGRLDAMRTTCARSTYTGSWRWRVLMFRIDHCVIPADWGVADAGTFTIEGSDHRGIRAKIGPASER